MTPGYTLLTYLYQHFKHCSVPFRSITKTTFNADLICMKYIYNPPYIHRVNYIFNYTVQCHLCTGLPIYRIAIIIM